MVGAISFRYSWTTGMKKKLRNLILKKGQIPGLSEIDTCSDLDWRNDFWVCPFPIKRSTTPSKYCMYISSMKLYITIVLFVEGKDFKMQWED